MVDDEEEFMSRYMRVIEQLLSTEPVDIFAWPTFLPVPIARLYQQLWTRQRIESIVWMANSFINFNGNRDLALNTMNWLSSDEDLISIRPKEREDRRITMTRAQMNWVRITSQFLFPLAVVIAGVTVWWRRR